MVIIVFLTLAAGIVQNPLQLGDELDAATYRFMQQHAEQLNWKMTQLLQDIEQTQEQNGVAGEVRLLAAFQQWWFWSSALGDGALVLLLLCWRTRKRSHKPESSCKQGIPGSQKEEEEVEEEDNDSGDTCDLHKFLANCIHWPVPYMADTCKLVEDLIDELLSACQRFSGSNIPTIGMGCVYEGWSAWENNVLYHLLVPLQRPPRHAFCLEMGTTEETLTNNSCLHVQLQCMCMREQLVEDILCFLHQHEDELKSHDPSLLNTLYTNSYLVIKKTACWFQVLMRDIWKFKPQSHHCQLTALPTTCSCKLRLMNTSQSIEMIFVVQLDDSDSFLSLE
ncbi:LOW QUALITY PROTEIN: inositol 1,4,5-trisphosphate receptor-interacting protein-like 1 [Ciconia maguari]